MKKLLLSVVGLLFVASICFDALAVPTVTVSSRTKNYNQWIISGSLAMDGDYDTGSELVTAAGLGCAYIEDFEIKGVESGYAFGQVIAAGGASVSVLAYSGALVIVSDNTDLSALTSVEFEAKCK